MDFSSVSIVDLASTLAAHLQKHGVDVVLVGGLVVEIYTENLYLTKDINMVNTNYKKPHTLPKVMGELGFQKQGRVYANETTNITVEFPSGPLAVGNKLITKTTVAKTAHGEIPILYVEDVVKDRLAAFIHWQDRQSLIQAIGMMLKHQITSVELKDFCLQEGDAAHYELLEIVHQQAQKQNINSMSQLESLLAQVVLNRL